MAALSPVKVLLVTSDREACGIREYGLMLKEAVEGSSNVQVEEFPFTAPDRLLDRVCSPSSRPDIVHLNHHAALHSQWGPDHIWALRALGMKVVVTQHDTFESWEIMQSRRFLDARDADLLIIHEKVEGLEGPRVWQMRQPIPEAPPAVKSGEAWLRRLKGIQWKHYVGSVGFNLLHKGFPTLVDGARRAGWGCRLIVPGITVEEAEDLQRIHPEGLELMTGWRPRGHVIAALATCDMLGFPYVTGGSGTSGALRLGIAARRPVFTSPKGVNRQTLDLPEDHWVMRVDPSPQGIEEALRGWADPKREFDRWANEAGILAEMDGWEPMGWELARRYVGLVRGIR